MQFPSRLALFLHVGVGFEIGVVTGVVSLAVGEGAVGFVVGLPLSFLRARGMQISAFSASGRGYGNDFDQKLAQ